LSGEGIDELKDRIMRFIQKDMEDIELTLPHKYYALAGMIREKGTVRREEYGPQGLFISARVPRKVKYAIFKKLRKREE